MNANVERKQWLILTVLLLALVVLLSITIPSISQRLFRVNVTPALKGVGRVGIGTAEQVVGLGAQWAYSWWIDESAFNNQYEHVPMIWGRDYIPAEVERVAKAHLGSYWLIWNEPDYWSSANIPVNEAAQIYYTLRPLIKNADPTAKLIVGNVFYSDLGWLRNFRSAYYNQYGAWPVVEGWGFHYYVGTQNYNKDTWRKVVTDAYNWMSWNGGSVEMWLTEFDCLGSEAIATQIMIDQLVWLQDSSNLNRFAWYATRADNQWCVGCAGSLLNLDGTLTALGVLYRNTIQTPVTTKTPTVVGTSTKTFTPLPTRTPTQTPVHTPTRTITRTPTATPIVTPSMTPTVTPTTNPECPLCPPCSAAASVFGVATAIGYIPNAEVRVAGLTLKICAEHNYIDCIEITTNERGLAWFKLPAGGHVVVNSEWPVGWYPLEERDGSNPWFIIASPGGDLFPVFKATSYPLGTPTLTPTALPVVVPTLGVRK